MIVASLVVYLLVEKVNITDFGKGSFMYKEEAVVSCLVSIFIDKGSHGNNQTTTVRF